MKFLLILILLFVAGTSFSQQALLKLPATGKTITAFIPKGYDTLATAAGDLNKDSVADVAIVLKSVLEDSEEGKAMDMDSLPPRVMIVLLKNKDGYSLAGQSNSAILCKGCGGVFGDPFAAITIAKGVLVVDHYGGSNWRWEYTHRFRYQQNDFYLIGQTYHSYWDVKMCDKLKDYAGTELKDVNLITGSYVEKKISEECKLLVNKKGKQAVEPLKKLSEFKLDN